MRAAFVELAHFTLILPMSPLPERLLASATTSCTSLEMLALQLALPWVVRLAHPQLSVQPDLPFLQPSPDLCENLYSNLCGAGTVRTHSVQVATHRTACCTPCTYACVSLDFAQVPRLIAPPFGVFPLSAPAFGSSFRLGFERCRL